MTKSLKSVSAKCQKCQDRLEQYDNIMTICNTSYKPLHGCRASLVSLAGGTEAVVPYDARPCSKAGRDERRSTDVETLTSLEKSQ